MIVVYQMAPGVGRCAVVVIMGLLGIFSSQSFASNLTILSLLPNMGESVLIGGVRLPWATQFTLNGSQARARRDNRCGFAFAYELVNSGKPSLTVRATSVTSNQRPLHLGHAFVLRMGDKKTVSGTIYLQNGLTNLHFQVEVNSGVVEKTAAVLVSGC